MEVAPPEDVFAVYEGHVASPLERSAAWRCARKDALSSPSVPAVDEFRKATEESENQQKKALIALSSTNGPPGVTLRAECPEGERLSLLQPGSARRFVSG
jgi:hypothetical protein